MAIIRPFAAYRPAQGKEQIVASLPYDVYSREEARVYVSQHPDSFLSVDRAETGLPAGTDIYAPEVYRKAHERLEEMKANGLFVRDQAPCFYLYEQTFNGRTQTGVVGCASIDDYLNNVIRKHENTVEEKEQDRIHHVDACNAQTGPIFLAHRHNEAVEEIKNRIRQTDPVCDFVSTDDRNPEMIHKVRNRIWVIRDAEDIQALGRAFAMIRRIYIADGHHRCASAVKVGLQRREAARKAGTFSGREAFNFFLSVFFSEDELEIMDYNRVVKDLGGLDRSEILSLLKRRFMVRPCKSEIAVPSRKGEIGMYIADSWYLLTAKNEIKSGDPVRGLDVSLLQEHVLEPVFGITDPRTDHRIEFTGGIWGPETLRKKADACGGCAFSMYPTSIRELFAVADAGRLMPPKSTWFEPKLLSGLFIHSF